MDSQKVKNKRNNSQSVQLVWGIALALMGIGVFFRIPYVIGRISGSEQNVADQFFIRFSLYMMSIVLFGGGSKKIFNVLRLYRDKKV